MKRQVLDILRCPNCKHDLTLTETQAVNKQIIEGCLKCNNCQRSFEITRGVPRMVMDLGNRKEIAESWDFEWSKVTKGMFEVDTLYGITEEEELNRFFSYLDVPPDDLRGKFILDAGCGRGRLIKALAKYGAEIFGIDISSTLVDVYEDCKAYKDVNIIRADILSLPFRRGAFDYVWSWGTIYMSGDTNRAFQNLSNLVKSSGKLFVTVLPARYTDFGDRLRNFLVISHRIPKDILFCLCYILALPLSLGKKIFNRARTSIRTTAFFLFDHLSPPVRSRHTEDEVINWFKEGNFRDISCINNKPRLLVRGTKR